MVASLSTKLQNWNFWETRLASRPRASIIVTSISHFVTFVATILNQLALRSDLHHYNGDSKLPATMAALLPDDLLHMICHQLWEQRDFDTLYHCARAGKQLAVPALASIYRMHDVAPVTSAYNDEIEMAPQERTSGAAYEKGREQLIGKWASMWRSLILSSLGRTLFPYSKYVRTLSLQDLEYLLQDSRFLGKTSSMFFKDGLEKFEVNRNVQISSKKSGHRIDAETTANRLLEVIAMQTPMLEELSGSILNRVLSQCIPKLPNLQRLNVYRGEALEGAGHLIQSHCPLFNVLQFYGWQKDDADQHLAAFLNDIRPQSLHSFEIFSVSQIGAQSFLALNCHRETLTELKLNGIKAESIPALSMLKGCTNLTSLLLSENSTATQDLEKRHNDIFLEVVAWLCQCKWLRTISLYNLLSSPALLTPVLLESSIHLTKLALEGYLMSESQDFHRALSQQTSLQDLWLKGESSDNPEDVDFLVESLSKLETLTDMRLQEVSDYFLDKHFCTLAKSLQRLEVWESSGYGITDAIWSDMASMKFLRRLEFNAQTRFTPNGIMDFILNLGSGNNGLLLNIAMQDVDFNLTDEEQSMIRETMTSKVEGRFDFMLFRDPEISEFEGDSD